MKKFLACLFAFACAASAHAAPAPRQNCETNIDADKIDAEVLKGKDGTATGNVIVTQCDMKMHADTVRVTTLNGQFDRIVANGHIVLVSQKSGVVTGDNGVYEVARKMVTITGHVVLKDGKNVASSTRGTYNLVTGVAMLDAPPATPGAPGGRVHAVLSQPADPAPK